MIYHINRLNTQKDTDTSSQFDRSVKVIQEIEDSFEWNSSGKIGYLYGEKNDLNPYLLPYSKWT